MEACSLTQIPGRLHTGDRHLLPCFEVGERLFRRCKPEEIDNPFATISLVDVSVNREGPTSVKPLCEPEDVLRDFSLDAKQEWLTGQKAIALTIKEVNEASTYLYKASLPNVTAPPNGGAVTENCIMVLVHDCEPCNYAHCAFQLWVDGIEVTFDNYKQTLGSNKYRKLRDQCRFELAKMLIKEEIWLPKAA